MRDRLKNVQQIQASQSAFAAVLGDESVVTWGSAADGGDSSAVQLAEEGAADSILWTGFCRHSW